MYDIDVDEFMLVFVVVDLVLEGIDFYVEIWLNGVVFFDCDGSQFIYKKDICFLMQFGCNCFEILFFEQEEEWLFDEEDVIEFCLLGYYQVKKYD